MIKNLIKKIVIILYSYIEPMENSILILESSYPSASNTNIIYKNKEKFINAGFSVKSMPYNSVRVTSGGLKAYLKHIVIMKEVSKYKYVLVTHSFQKYNKRQTLIDFWHGIPLKAMKFMELDATEVNRPINNADVLITSSKVESTLMNASFHTPFINHRILGSPRNDYLVNSNRDDQSLDFIRNFDFVLFYIPTFRTGYFDRVEGIDYGTLFNLETFNENEFVNFLKENNALLITKYHPREAETKNINFNISDNIFNLSNEFLIENDLDLYEVLKFSSMLITDYSSIYFDYLLLDKPILFNPTDLESYRESRGFILEPYEFWTPGAKVLTQENLQNKVLDIIRGNDEYKAKRNEMKSVFHRYTDGKSLDRFIEFLKKQ